MTLGTSAIYRIDTTGETESDATTANEIIEFGTGATNPDARSILKSVRIQHIEDLSIHPNPNRHLSQIQANKLGTIEYIIRGEFKRPDSAGGVTKLLNWMTNDKTNTSLPFGRFGIRVDNISQLDLTPSATIGLILFNSWIEDVEDFQSNAEFELHLYRNGSV